MQQPGARVGRTLDGGLGYFSFFPFFFSFFIVFFSLPCCIKPITAGQNESFLILIGFIKDGYCRCRVLLSELLLDVVFIHVLVRSFLLPLVR